MMGRPAFGLKDPRRFSLVLFNNILGGPGMNSRLNLNVREKYGFTYTIESGYHTYTDSGIFHVYFATDSKHFNARELVEKEENLREITSRFRQYKEK
jgi:predicted Zn-dependent peptidase